MGVQAGTGLSLGTLAFLVTGVVVAIAIAFYVRQKTKDISMKTSNAK